MNGRPADPSYFLPLLLSGMNMTVGLIGLIDTSIAIFIIWLVIRKLPGTDGEQSSANRATPVERAAAVICLLFILLGIPYVTLPLWRHSIILQLIQFTFRLDLLILLFGCVLLAIGTTSQRLRLMSLPGALWSLAGIGIAAMAVLGLRVHTPLRRYTSYDPAEYAPISASADIFEVVRFVRAHEHDDYVIAAPMLSQNERLQAVRSPVAGGTFACDLETDHRVTLHTFYWPQFHLRVVGIEIPITPTSDGRMSFTLPKGKYRAELTLDKSETEIEGEWLSFFGLGGILLIGTFVGITRRRGRKRSAAQD